MPYRGACARRDAARAARRCQASAARTGCRAAVAARPRTRRDACSRRAHLEAVLWLGPAGRRAGARPRARHPAPRPQAGQRPADRRRRADAARLQPRRGHQAPRRRRRRLVGGTLPYMAPEQLQAFLRPSSDLPTAAATSTRLGIVLFELLTGTFPFAPGPCRRRRAANGLAAMLDRARATAPPRLRGVNPAVSPAVGVHRPPLPGAGPGPALPVGGGAARGHRPAPARPAAEARPGAVAARAAGASGGGAPAPARPAGLAAPAVLLAAGRAVGLWRLASCSCAPTHGRGSGGVLPHDFHAGAVPAGTRPRAAASAAGARRECADALAVPFDLAGRWLLTRCRRREQRARRGRRAAAAAGAVARWRPATREAALKLKPRRGGASAPTSRGGAGRSGPASAAKAGPRRDEREATGSGLPQRPRRACSGARAD